jgi:hypothetical protein
MFFARIGWILMTKRSGRPNMMLTQVEKAFRSLKPSLGLQPNFHQVEPDHCDLPGLCFPILSEANRSIRIVQD